jgi:hypothetical protein
MQLENILALSFGIPTLLVAFYGLYIARRNAAGQSGLRRQWREQEEHRTEDRRLTPCRATRSLTPEIQSTLITLVYRQSTHVDCSTPDLR